MKHLIIQTVKKYFSNEADRQRLSQYDILREQPGWIFHVEALRFLQGLILQEIMSKSFTESSKEEKDVQQRAFKGIYDVIEFLIDPVAQAKTVLAIKQHNKAVKNRSDQ